MANDGRYAIKPELVANELIHLTNVCEAFSKSQILFANAGQKEIVSALLILVG